MLNIYLKNRKVYASNRSQTCRMCLSRLEFIEYILMNKEKRNKVMPGKITALTSAFSTLAKIRVL